MMMYYSGFDAFNNSEYEELMEALTQSEENTSKEKTA